MSERRILTIRFGSTDADYGEFAETWHAIENGALENGEGIAVPTHALTFESLGGFLSCLTEKRWTLLHALRLRGPSSVRALAMALERDYKNVHADVQRLSELDLIARDSMGKVYVPWDEIDARIALAA